MKYLVIALVFLQLTGETCFAYIPKIQTVLKNIASQRNDQPLRIRKEVRIKTSDDQFLVEETWWVKPDENTILIEARGPGFQYQALHQNSLRFRKNEQNQLLQSRTSPAFFAPLLLSHDPNVLASYLVSAKILLPQILQRSKPVYSIGDIQYPSESYIRLTRKEGVVHFGLGPLDPATETELRSPHLWVLQDNFQISKMRQDDFVIELSNYKKFDRSLDYPEKTLLRWGLADVSIQTLSIETIQVGPKTKEKFLTKNLVAKAKVSDEATRNPTLNLVDEFYQKFR